MWSDQQILNIQEMRLLAESRHFLDKMLKQLSICTNEIQISFRKYFQGYDICGCTGSWGTLAWGEGQLGEVPLGGSAT